MSWRRRRRQSLPRMYVSSEAGAMGIRGRCDLQRPDLQVQSVGDAAAMRGGWFGGAVKLKSANTQHPLLRSLRSEKRLCACSEEPKSSRAAVAGMPAVVLLLHPWATGCSVRLGGHNPRIRAWAGLRLREVLTMVPRIAIRPFSGWSRVRKVGSRWCYIVPSPPKALSRQQRLREAIKVAVEDDVPLDKLLEQSQGIRGNGGVVE
ncbi:hypothetical protein FB567DRAFT_149280 [Paraphoma chrysanthemicola]|uniref:Uncharacterized protein n=1 Tax=Paraphoma chrysanthemicola TaxID=798071 RepID=A0A8K0R0A3_9PLEO|nr:hypothetical protein FB567DRAFT_149280 [Paraphoma chrysanthemicola]